jgi:hypothetical protein
MTRKEEIIEAGKLMGQVDALIEWALIGDRDPDHEPELRRRRGEIRAQYGAILSGDPARLDSARETFAELRRLFELPPPTLGDLGLADL